MQIAVATLLGVAGNAACVMRHCCIGGHMQHPPYGVAEYLLDGVWPLFLLFAVWRSRVAAPRIGRWFPALVLGLIGLRFGGPVLSWFGDFFVLVDQLVGLVATLGAGVWAVRLLSRGSRGGLPGTNP